MFGSTNTKLWSGGTQYGYIMAEYPEGSQCQITRELDDKVLKARGSGSNWAFALPEVIGLKVPKEYQEVEYLQSSGTQYIDCGYIPIDTERYIIDGMFSASSSMIGTYGGQGWSLSYSDGIYQVRTVGIRYDKSGADFYRHIFDWSKNNFTVDGISYTSTTSAGFVIGNYNLWLFGPGPGYGGTKLNGRIYNAKTYIGDNLIHHYIPCYRKSDSVAGMYDAITDTFFTNAGTGTFVIGPAVGEEWTAYCTDGENEAERKVNILYNGDIESTVLYYRVPAEYQAVEYLQSSGTQYIDCNYVPVNTERYVCDGKFDAYNCSMFGTNDGNGWSFSTAENSFQWRAVGIRYQKAWDLNKHVFNCYQDGMTVDGENYTGTLSAAYTIGNVKFWLFGPGPGNSGTKLTGKIYDFQTYIGDNLIHHYCPCYRKSDGVAGMWDYVNEVFYINTGTGTFTVGPDM